MLNQVELTERVRSLTPVQRAGYSIIIAIGIVGAFCFAIGLGVGLAAVLVILLLGSPLTLPDDLIALSLPMIIVFMFTIGTSGIDGQNKVMSGQDLGRMVRKAVRSGLIVGLIAGAVFGFGWGFLINADALLFALVMGLSLALPLAFFRVVACVIEPLSLRLVESQRHNAIHGG